MRNKVLLVVLFMLGVLVGLGATSVFAQGPTSAPAVSDNQTWQQMQQACINGDFQTMQQLHNGVCGGTGTTGGATGGTTGWRGMMGNAWSGMMGGWWNNGNTQQNTPGYSGITGNRWNGMMGGSRGGMMGNW